MVFRPKAEGLEVMILVGHDGNFDLPKGTLRYGEALEACALREVEEESGQKIEVSGYLGSKLTTGDANGTEISKTTHYFALGWRPKMPKEI